MVAVVKYAGAAYTLAHGPANERDHGPVCSYYPGPPFTCSEQVKGGPGFK